VDLIVFVLPLLLLVFLFTSQRKRQRSVQQLQSSLEPGQQVLTTSGLFARIVELDDAVAVLETGPGHRVRWDRRAIGSVVHEGSRGYLPPAGTQPGPVADGDYGTDSRPSSLTSTSDPADPTQTAPGEPGYPARPGDQNPRS
jgi:preprotein translocase subunit YajC